MEAKIFKRFQKVSTKTLEDHGIDKLRKHQESKATAVEEDEIVEEDNFDKIYKGEVSKSGTAILPSKRAKRIPEKIKVSEEPEPEIERSTEESVKDPIAEEKISEDSEPNQ